MITCLLRCVLAGGVRSHNYPSMLLIMSEILVNRRHISFGLMHLHFLFSKMAAILFLP